MVLTSTALIFALVFLLASMLVIADRWLFVPEDPRIAAVEQMLPHTNCGACGYPGCHAFAEALVSGEAAPVGCTVSAPPDHVRIAQYLGVNVGAQVKRVARLACAGGSNVARNRAHYEGAQSCAAAALVSGGGKACFWGCLGLADCEAACDFDAITMDEHELPVVNENLCTACGDCVEACPKDLFSLHDVTHRLWVACSSLAAGDEVLEECEVACTACGRCASDAPDQIAMQNGLPVIDYRRGPLTSVPTERCPTGAILWLSEHGPVKGKSAHPVIRHGPRPDRMT